jgi:hypothetical protein
MLQSSYVNVIVIVLTYIFFFIIRNDHSWIMIDMAYVIKYVPLISLVALIKVKNIMWAASYCGYMLVEIVALQIVVYAKTTQ